MKKRIKSSIKKARARMWDIIFSPLTLIAALWFKKIRKFGLKNMPISDSILTNVGIYPLNDHYYEPLIKRKSLDRNYRKQRSLSGIDWNVDGQLNTLKNFNFQKELADIPQNKTKQREYFYLNGNFEAGDGGFFYSMIRSIKPKKIIEIGCGYSTLVAVKAIAKNKIEAPEHTCELTCVEPYRQHWLADLPVKLIKEPVEKLDIEIFSQLEENDILFIDSSHMIRPQGDVLFEYLTILPSLKKGVIVHVHDIFSPFDYPNEWIIDGQCFWDEQYLLEAFLSFNSEYKIIGALNYLKAFHQEALLEKIPLLDSAGSFWMKKE